MKNRVLHYDFETLPEVPFPVYFLNKEGEVFPKKIFTVTNKAINYEKEHVDLFILELKQDVAYHPDHITRVQQLHVN